MQECLRVVLYARYSSDLQNPASIEDQFRLCHDIVRRALPGGVVVKTYQDAAISGATMERPGLLDLLEDVEAGRIDVIVSEGLDRISRNLGDMARIHQLCRNADCRIYTGHEGEVGDLHVGFKGTMNALFLKDMKAKVSRAHKAIAAQGRAPAGISYGYRVVRGELDEKGQ